MDWINTTFFAFYAAISIGILVLWWLIYDLVLSRGHSLREAVFGHRPNPAVAMDLLGGLLASAILLYSIIAWAPRSNFRHDVLAVALNIVLLLVLLTVLRFVVAGVLRVWFRERRDAQGDIITINNELFKQRNIATGIFSTVTYLILVAGLVELDLFDQDGERLATIWNLLGVWLLGLALIVIHSFFYLEYGTRNHILHESFHDNNPAAPSSLLGLVAGILPLNHHFLVTYGPGQHMFNTPELWMSLGMVLLFVLVARGVLQVLLWAITGINLRRELVVRDNVAWGLLDGGLIFSLVLIFMAQLV